MFAFLFLFTLSTLRSQVPQTSNAVSSISYSYKRDTPRIIHPKISSRMNSMDDNSIIDSEFVERMVIGNDDSVFAAVSVAAFAGRTLKISPESLRDRVMSFPDYSQFKLRIGKDDESFGAPSLPFYPSSRPLRHSIPPSAVFWEI